MLGARCLNITHSLRAHKIYTKLLFFNKKRMFGVTSYFLRVRFSYSPFFSLGREEWVRGPLSVHEERPSFFNLQFLIV